MHNRRKFLVQFAMAAGAVTFLRPLNSLAGTRAHLPGVFPPNKLTLLHTANLHGQWKSLASYERMAGLGGLENLCKKIRAVRQENTAVLLVDTGNLISRYRGERKEHLLFCKQLAEAGYDAVVPGETDLAHGAPYFSELARESNLCRGAAPYGRSAWQRGHPLPYYLVNRGNHQVALIDCSGAALQTLPNYSFGRAVAAASATAARLKDKNPCLLTLCLLQEDGAKSQAFAEASAHIDILATSAPGRLLQNVLVMRNERNEEVLVSFAGEKGTMLSRIDLTFDERGKKVQVQSKAEVVSGREASYATLLKRYPFHKT